MSRSIENIRRSNHSIFLPRNYGSPFNDMAEHISGLGLARIDFERCAIAGEVIYSVDGDSTPTSQQDEEARIATLAYALKKLGNPEDVAEFMRCLNAICEEGDARYRQVAASYYYKEIAERGVGHVLKEMALLAMQLASLNPVTEDAESDSEVIYALYAESKSRSLFDREVAEVERLIRGRRKSACFARDEWTEWLSDLEANGASLEELDEAFAQSVLQRERLERAPLSKEARSLIREVETASSGKLRYLSWAFYKGNQPEHPIHSLPIHMVSRIWDILKTRKLEILGPDWAEPAPTSRCRRDGEKEGGQRRARLSCSRLSCASRALSQREVRFVFPPAFTFIGMGWRSKVALMFADPALWPSNRFWLPINRELRQASRRRSTSLDSTKENNYVIVQQDHHRRIPGTRPGDQVHPAGNSRLQCFGCNHRAAQERSRRLRRSYHLVPRDTLESPG
jgi:hypothetical protein